MATVQNISTANISHTAYCTHSRASAIASETLPLFQSYSTHSRATAINTNCAAFCSCYTSSSTETGVLRIDILVVFCSVYIRTSSNHFVSMNASVVCTSVSFVFHTTDRRIGELFHRNGMKMGQNINVILLHTVCGIIAELYFMNFECPIVTKRG